MAAELQYYYQQIHIDAARNSTDDFNPFHEPRKFARIRGNPYPGSIVIGFQLECLIEYLVTLHRDERGERTHIEDRGLHYSNYQFGFADALLPGERFSADLKPSRRQGDSPVLANRIVVRKETGFVLLGYKRETDRPLFLADVEFDCLPDLRSSRDRTCLPGTDWFLKRKFMNTGNAKNFLAGSLADQGFYFDELEDRASFPDRFPCALLSCALLEKAVSEGHDFMADPLVYLTHNLSVDRRLIRRLRSNDALHMLVRGPLKGEGTGGLGGSGVEQDIYHCIGLIHDDRILYRAEGALVSLQDILAAKSARAA